MTGGEITQMFPKPFGTGMAQQIVTCFEILDNLIQLKIGR